MGMPKLTTRQVANLKEPGFYGDGEGLHLKVSAGGGKSWILRTMVHGKRRDFGLGSASLVPLAEARETARAYRKVARQGGDPMALRKQKAILFSVAARRVYEQNRPTWRNAKHASGWMGSVEKYALPVLGDRLIHTIGTADVLEVITPIWTTKHETARRLKQRLSTIFDWAKGNGFYPHENPVNGVTKSLPRVKADPEHMAAMHWRDLPAFMDALSWREGVSARTLEFIILTASRSNEARGARWEEIDFDEQTWTVPRNRMKRGKPHRVPLSLEAMAVLDHQRGLDPEYIFPSATRGKDGKNRPQSVMVFKALFKRMGHDGFTTHGFRSTFRDWCSEQAMVQREVAEMALSHAVGNDVERAYARSDLFERRRALMDAWAAFTTAKTGNVTRLVRI
jgi:integrase